MRIRAAEIADAATIAQVNARSWQAAYANIIPSDALAKMVAAQSAENYWTQIIRLHTRLHRTIVVENDMGQIVGCATFGPEQRRNREYKGELYSLYLLPEFHAQGLGRALVAEAARQLAYQGMTSMLVWVLTDNHAGRGFYEHIGGVWLGEGRVDICGMSLATVAYGWRNTALLLPQPQTPSAFTGKAVPSGRMDQPRMWLRRLFRWKKL